jgi:hypothetical protein
MFSALFMCAVYASSSPDGMHCQFNLSYQWYAGVCAVCGVYYIMCIVFVVHTVCIVSLSHLVTSLLVVCSVNRSVVSSSVPEICGVYRYNV